MRYPPNLVSYKSRRRRLLRTVVAVFVVLVLAAGPSFGQGSWLIGAYRFLVGPASAPLAYTLRGMQSLGSFLFLNGVGGVAFAEVASPAPELRGKPISLSYNEWAPDGERLRVEIAGSSYSLPAHDWILLPVAKYADSEYNACFSLFGPEYSETQYDIVYHEALQDTLLGMRILQADIQLMILSEAWQLARYGEVVVLGPGETPPDRMDRISAQLIDSIVWEHEFWSWVLTDVDVKVQIELSDNTVTLSGEPYYYFWTVDEDEYDRLLNQAEWYYSIGKEKAYNETLDEIDRLPTLVEAPTKGLIAGREALRAYNTPVYDATRTTMRLAAFFRYVKQQNSRGWSTFVDQISAREPTPSVTTPTRWDRY